MTRWAGPAVAYAAVTAALTYPLLARFGSAVPHDPGDPLLNTWLLWWSTQQLPLTDAWWNAPMFYPLRGAMGLSELLIGLLPLTAFTQVVSGNPLAAYNLAFVLSYPLSALAAYALALELTGRRDAAFLAGLAFAFAPYRATQLSHLQVLSYYWAPLALLGLHRYRRTGHRRDLMVFGVSWLMQALTNGYAIFHLSVLVALWIVWFARPFAAAIPILAAWAVAALPLAPLLLGYRAIQSSLHLVRDINEIKRFGVDLMDVARVAPELVLWGRQLGAGRPETAIFPGLTLIGVAVVAAAALPRLVPRAGQSRDQRLLTIASLIAALVALSAVTIGPWSIGPLTVGDFRKPFSIALALRLLAWLRGSWFRAAWREQSLVPFYLVAMGAMYLLAMGPEPRFDGRPILYEPPYAWLMRVPGFEVLRVPARFAMLALLCQAALLALAVAHLPAIRNRARTATALLTIGLLLDGWIRLPVVAAPSAGPDWTAVSSVVELPLGMPTDTAALMRSIAHQTPVVNGYSGYNAPHYLPLQTALSRGEYSALAALSSAGPLGIAVDQAAAGSRQIADGIAGLEGIEPGPSTAGWTTFVLRASPPAQMALGPRLAIVDVRANRHPEDVGRLRDGDLWSAWGSNPNQIGDEELTIDLGAERELGAVRFELAAYSFGFPRVLEIEVSADGSAWLPAWRGETAGLTVRAAIADPGTVPLTIELGRVIARYLRLRQTGTEPGIPWWIAELSINAPPPAP